VFLMPYWGFSALLRLDIHLRTPQMLRLFRCAKKKKVVVSDSTITRVLNWLDPQDCRQALLAPLPTLNQEGLLQLTLAPKRPSRRLGVIDGSQMGDHYLVAALLCGQVNVPVLAEPCKGRGHELKTTQQLLPIAHQLLGAAAPQLWLLDALYFNQVESRDGAVPAKGKPVSISRSSNWTCGFAASSSRTGFTASVRTPG